MLTAQYMPEVYGGAEQQCRKLASGLVKKGAEVTILTSRKNRRIKSLERVNGVQVKRLLSYGPPQLLNARYFHSAFIWVTKTVWWAYANRKSFDIVHVHQAKIQAFAGLLIARLTKKRSIIKIGNSGSGFDLITLKRKAVVGTFLYNYVLRHADIVIAISRDIEQELLASGIPARNIVFLPNGVEMNLELPLDEGEKKQFRQSLNLPVDKTIFIFIGRLEKQKDILLLIESFAMTNPLLQNFYLVIIGDGDYRKEVESTIIQYNIEQSVFLAGYQQNVFSYIKAADFFILSTKTEGLSNALLEAMSGGLIPISTAVSGSKDIIKENINGFLTEAGSKASLQQAILKAGSLSTEERKTFSKHCFTTIKENYEISFITDQYINLYKSLGSVSDVI